MKEYKVYQTYTQVDKQVIKARNKKEAEEKALRRNKWIDIETLDYIIEVFEC